MFKNRDNMVKDGNSWFYILSNIGLAKTLPSNRAHFRTVLSEELGHHFMTVGERIPKTLFHYADRLTISKDEYKALKWAAELEKCQIGNDNERQTDIDMILSIYSSIA